MAAPSQSYEVLRYDEDALKRLLVQNPKADRDYAELKPHIKYLQGYLAALGASTIVVEREYIDHDYLEDFAAYYVRCFSDYERRCARLHFFRCQFTPEQFGACLRREDEGVLLPALLGDDSYLGFIVVKPLPRTSIGRTCLRVYPPEGGREFPITRSYPVSLFGIDLNAGKTLAFQEQDQATAACASSALWTAFQGTGLLFQHHIPSPSEITKAALSRFPLAERDFPNQGLTVAQMAHAIRSVGLDPLCMWLKPGTESALLVQRLVYAYLKGGIPILLGVVLHGLPDNPWHAVAVTGYKLGLPSTIPDQASGLLLRASRMDKVYAHDDGVGPFARMEFGTGPVPADGGGTRPATLFKTSWRDAGGSEGNVFAEPVVLLVPLYHKIRIPYSSVFESVVGFDAYLELLRHALSSHGGEPILPDRMEWDVHLTTVNVVKGEIASEDLVSSDYREEVLLQPMPKYIWRGTARNGDRKVIDLLYDATDIDQGSFFARAVEYDYRLSCVLRELARDPAFEGVSRTHPVWTVLRWFAEQSQDRIDAGKPVYIAQECFKRS